MSAAAIHMPADPLPTADTTGAFTAAERDYLHQSWWGGLALIEIAEVLGRSFDEIAREAERLGLPPRRQTGIKVQAA